MKASLPNFPGKRAYRLLVTTMPAKEKTRSDVTDERGQDKYESARRVSAGHSFLWRYQYFFSSRLALPSGERTGNTGAAGVLPEVNKLRLRQNRSKLRLRPSGPSAQHYLDLWVAWTPSSDFKCYYFLLPIAHAIFKFR